MIRGSDESDQQRDVHVAFGRRRTPSDAPVQVHRDEPVRATREVVAQSRTDCLEVHAPQGSLPGRSGREGLEFSWMGMESGLTILPKKIFVPMIRATNMAKKPINLPVSLQNIPK